MAFKLPELEARRIELGYDKADLAKLLGLSGQMYTYRMHVPDSFKRSEIRKLIYYLKLSPVEAYNMFIGGGEDVVDMPQGMDSLNELGDVPDILD